MIIRSRRIVRDYRGTRLPSSILVAIRPRFLPSHRHNGQLVRRACIGVYRPIGTAAGVLLPFVIYAALSSAPQQRSYSFDRSNPSVVYISLPLSSLLLPPLFESLALDIVIRYRCSNASNRRAGSTRDRVFLLLSSLVTFLEPNTTVLSPRDATPRHADAVAEEKCSSPRNLISRLMSLLIARPPPHRLFIGADRDHPWAVAYRTVSFHSIPHSFPPAYDLFYSSVCSRSSSRITNRVKDVPRSARFIRDSVKNRDADTSLVFLSCHCTTWPYIFRQRTSPLHPRAARVSISSHE